MPNTRDDCIRLAEDAGFDAYRAGQVCDVAFGESGYGNDTRCACQACCDSSCTSGCGPIFHDADCKSQGMTGHCGVFQMDESNPTFQPVIASGCANDLACSLKAMFGITQGGKCFDGPSPWGPHFGKPYGGCGGQADSSLKAAAGSGTCDGFCAVDIGSYSQPIPWIGPCPFNMRQATATDFAGHQCPGTAASGGSSSGGGIGDVFKLAGKLLNPQTWLNAGIIIAGFVTVMIGINALLSGKVAAGVKDSARAAVLA